jgi:hypothetical protein
VGENKRPTAFTGHGPYGSDAPLGEEAGTWGIISPIHDFDERPSPYAFPDHLGPGRQDLDRGCGAEEDQ